MKQISNTLLNGASFHIAAVKPKQWPEDLGYEVAFAGRSNVGKSSAINSITHRHGLARTSKTPGRTQQIIFFNLDKTRRLVDLPGYGYAKVPLKVRAQWGTMIETYLTARDSLKGVVVLIDSRHPLTELDQQMLMWCDSTHIQVHILLTKCDKLSRNQLKQSEFSVQKHIDSMNIQASLQTFSSLKGIGLDTVQQKILTWLNT